MALQPHPAVNADLLLAAAYARFRDPFAAAILGNGYLVSYQKRIVDQAGVRYVLAVHHAVKPEDAGGEARECFCAETQFIRAGALFNVELLWRGQSIAEVEAFFADLWTSLGLDYVAALSGGISVPSMLRH